MNSYNVYEKLYANTKSAFTIIKNDKQYSLGEYMRMKAGNKNQAAEKKHSTDVSIVSNSFSNIKEKLANNKPAKKFPLRSAASALLSALIVSSLAISFGAFSKKNINSEVPTIESEIIELDKETSSLFD